VRLVLLPVPLAALVGCDFYPEADELPSVPYLDCNPVIGVPAISGGPSDVPADAHAETYGASPFPVRVRYNWPSYDPSKSAAFLWSTDVDTLASSIEYGVGDALDRTFEGASFRFGGGEDGEGDHRVHEVRLCGLLEPGTTYSYRVGGPEAWSQTYQFTTPQAPGTFDAFRVAISGDARGSYESWGTIVAAMDSFDPDFFMFSGDMVDLGPDQGEWDAFFDAAGDVFARRPLLPAHGNHEFLAVNYFAQFSLPGNEEWYNIRFGDLSMVSLNDTVRDFDHVEFDAVALMNQAFGENPGGWKVAMHHQPIYSTCTTHGSYEGLREVWEPAFDAHEVHLVFAGHNHIYERSVPIRAGEQVPVEDGTIYVVSGGAGAPLYEESDAEWFGDVANPVEHFVIADFTATEATLTAYDLAGNVIDTFVVPR
jgi:hypothetical protein